MIDTIFSGDYPKSRVLNTLLLAIFVGLALGPFLFSGAVAFSTITNICIFIVLVASYDVLLGYTHIVSLAHTMFYGIGAYAVAITMNSMGATWGGMFLGVGAGVAVAAVIALLVGLLSLRVKALFFALVTLAVAVGFGILISKFYAVTGGEQGLGFRPPRELGPAFKLFDEKWYGFNILGWLRDLVTDPGNLASNTEKAVFDVRMSGRLVLYYVIFLTTVALFLLMLRMMNSPFGRVLKAIRENEFRAEALGYRTVVFRTINVVIAGAIAALAGAMAALSDPWVTPDSYLSLNVMVNILLMCVIGGMGTLYGAIVGATIFILAETYLKDLMGVAYDLTAGFFNALPGWLEWLGFIHELINPDRWYFWMGLLFVLSVYFFPAGVVGQFRAKELEEQIAASDDEHTKPT
jgi:branched-chain amino acid transport system permease protein